MVNLICTICDEEIEYCYFCLEDFKVGDVCYRWDFEYHMCKECLEKTKGKVVQNDKVEYLYN